MAGQIKVIDFIDAITTSRTKGVSNGGAPVSWKRVNLWVDVEVITRTTGSAQIQLRWKSSAGNTLDVTANIVGIIAAGLNEFALDGQWTNGTTDAIPEPSEAVVTFVGDTSLFTARVYMFASD